MFFNKKGGEKVTHVTKLVAVFMAIVTFCLLTGAVIDLQTKHVTLVITDEFADTAETQELTTRQNTVEEFLKEAGVTLGEFDQVNTALLENVADKSTINVRRGKTFSLLIDGNVQIITTTKKILKDALLDAGIALSASDRVEPGLESIISDDFSATVHRVVTEEITEKEPIPFTTKKVNDSSLAKGKTKIKTRGVSGQKSVTYAVTKEDGIEIKREKLSETILKEPTTQVVLVGTKKVAEGKKTVVTNAGETLNYSKKLTVTATAYTAASGKKTASGRVAQYGVIAVDPKVIPLGTKLYVESTDDGKSWQYGYCIAGDTGGAIKGNKIDLYYNSKTQCLQFGRRSAIVYVLN